MRKVLFLVIATAILVMFSVPVFGSSITLDHVWGQFSPGEVNSCQPLKFYFRYTNDGTYPFGGITNGYKLWTARQSQLLDPALDTLPIDFGGGAGWRDVFDLIFVIQKFQTTPYACTLVVGGSKGSNGEGLPAGFDAVAICITATVMESEDTFCIDSSYYPPTGTWLWASTAGPNVKPAWGGPYCFWVALAMCGVPQMNACPDTIFSVHPDPVTYQFEAIPFLPLPSVPVYAIETGPGTIDPTTGLWSASIPRDQLGIAIPLVVYTWDSGCIQCNRAECATTLMIFVLGDINIDGSSDVGDLVYMVEHMFNGGPEPPRWELEDVDGSGSIDIADLVYLVDYEFGNGPPPVNPWP